QALEPADHATSRTRAGHASPLGVPGRHPSGLPAGQERTAVHPRAEHGAGDDRNELVADGGEGCASVVRGHGGGDPHIGPSTGGRVGALQGSDMIKRIRPNRRCNLDARPPHRWKIALARVLVALMVLAAGAGAGWYGWLRAGPDLLAWGDRFFVIRTVDLTEGRRFYRTLELAVLDISRQWEIQRT